MNTHSRWADGRAELFCAHAALCGADRDTARALMDSATADQCLLVLDRAELRAPVLDSLLEAVPAPFGPAGGGAVLCGRGAVQQSIRPFGDDPGRKGDLGNMADKLGTFYGVGVAPEIRSC